MFRPFLMCILVAFLGETPVFPMWIYRAFGPSHRRLAQRRHGDPAHHADPWHRAMRGWELNLKWWSGRWFSFSIGWFLGSMLIFRGCKLMVKSNGIPLPKCWKNSGFRIVFVNFAPALLRRFEVLKKQKTHPFFKAARTTDNETSFLQQCTCLKASTGSVSKCCLSHVYCPEGFSPISFHSVHLSFWWKGGMVFFPATWHYFKLGVASKKTIDTILLHIGEFFQPTFSQHVGNTPGASDSPFRRRFTGCGGPQSDGPPHDTWRHRVPTSHVAVAKKKPLTVVIWESCGWSKEWSVTCSHSD